MNRHTRAAVIALSLGIAAPAHADRTEAERFFRNGAQAYKDGQFAIAATNFDKAFEQFAAAEIAFSAAQSHRLQYQADNDPVHLARAIFLFERYLELEQQGGRRRDALAHLERLRDIRAKLQTSTATVQVVEQRPELYVSVGLEAALITVDGAPAQRYTPIVVAEGDHDVVVTADGYVPATRKVPVGKGRSMIAIELTPLPATLTVRTAPGARISIDGRPVALRGDATEVAAGRRLLTVSARGRTPVSREVELTPGGALAVDAPLSVTAQRAAVRWIWVASGVLATGALVAGGVSLQADLEASDLRDRRPFGAAGTTDVASYEGARDRRDRYRTTGIALGGAAVLAFAGGLAMYFLDNPSTESQLRPVEPSRGGAGFAPIALGDDLGLGVGYSGGF